MANGKTTLYELIADAIERAMSDTSKALPPILETANPNAIDQAIADMRQAATDAANAGIDHGQQRGRTLHHINAAKIGRCYKTRHIADHAAAQGQDRSLAIQACSQ